MVCFAALLGWTALPLAALQQERVVRPGADGRLEYLADEQGNRVPDFSHAGYGGGGVAIPRTMPTLGVNPVEGEDGVRLQALLDAISEWPLGANGMRGALVLAPGTYEIADQLRITASGVVLRGSGSRAEDTVLVAQAPGRRTLIEVKGVDDRVFAGEPVPVRADYVPVGAMELPVADASGFSVGALIQIHRPATDAWLAAVEMDEAPARTPYKWRPVQWDMSWDREIVAIRGNTLVLDAPLTTALEARFGGATVQAYTWPGQLENVGVENLRLVSAYDAAHPADEEHAWIAIQLDAVRDAWVADITGLHFVSSLVDLGYGARRVTVQDCRSLQPVSELAGYRRVTFHTRGQQTLFVRCYAEDGLHDFVAGNLTTGPNVFLESEAHLPHSFSGSIGSWASGLLFDNVDIDGDALVLDNVGAWNQGVGWTTANSMIWQSQASVIRLNSPPTAVNWADSVWAQFYGAGRWMNTSSYSSPQSLYRAQMEERLGSSGLRALEPLSAPKGAPRDLAEAVPDLEARLAPKPRPHGQDLRRKDGWLVANDALLVGGERSITWWRGSVVPARAATLGVNITRFAPGMIGTGLTDDLDALTDAMVTANDLVIRHHYGLWHDRRRDDHERTRRIDADVWPPFFEMPWARSGKGTAWHGLSRYDLTRFNPWYFSRLAEFAEFGRQKGRVLINEMYFQHNILESGAHWVDMPWREANSVQKTGFPEPPPFVGDRIFMAEDFYDISQPARREWHRLYIRQCLANLATHPNVIHTVSAEFTGPLHFVEFWLDVIAEWQAETGHNPLIAISTTKDVQDAVLADPRYAPIIDVIDFTYWLRNDDGSDFAPKGGINRAPRQNSRSWMTGGSSGRSIASMVAEYRERFPEKAIITSLPRADGWAFVAAGGSFPRLPATTAKPLLEALARMQPQSAAEDAWVLAEPGVGFFGYALRGGLKIDLNGATGLFREHRIDLATGLVTRTDRVHQAGQTATFSDNGRFAVWLRAESDLK